MKNNFCVRKLLAVSMSLAMLASMSACGSAGKTTEGNATINNEEVPASASDSSKTDDKKYIVGICQLVQHQALDAATKGFKDALTEEFGDKVVFEEQNASGDSAQCTTICTGFASENVDLILANATPALQAAASSTKDIPILGTSITEYGVALSIKDFNGTVGGNISGTSDLAPLTKQAQMVQELVPDAKNVGILYCSAEANSEYQTKVVKKELEDAGLNVSVYTFSDSNDVASVTKSACDSNDVIYIPTDNTAASCTEAINNVATTAKVPIVTGEENMCKGCGIATLSIDYYELGVTTGKMAAKILNGEDISKMPIEYYENPVKKYNKKLCDLYGIKIPDGYEEIKD